MLDFYKLSVALPTRIKVTLGFNAKYRHGFSEQTTTFDLATVLMKRQEPAIRRLYFRLTKIESPKNQRLVIAPIDPTHLRRDQHNDAKGDAIPGEYSEIVSADKSYQAAHGNKGADKRHRAADGKQGKIV